MMKDIDKENWKKVEQYMEQVVDSEINLGRYYSSELLIDIKHILFTLSRYKFVSKLIMYKKNVKILELGCSEALGGLLFKQNTDLKKYVGVDLDRKSIEWNKKNLPTEMEFIESNFFDCKEIEGKIFNTIVSLDVIEHIQTEKEDEFCQLIVQHISDDGMVVIGTPNIEMSEYANEAAKVTHINLYDQKRLYQLLNNYFHNVFIFNMNDEVVNTGFAPMSCYIFAVCCNKK